MEFSNLFILFLFLPLCVSIYYLVPGTRGRNGVLLVMSLLFYALGDLRALPLLLVLSLLNYSVALWGNSGRALLYLCLIVDLGALLLCKLLLTEVPLGLSFYTFSLIAYVVDVFRKKTAASESFLDFLLFVALFPKLLMGPILRYETVEKELKQREHSPKDIFEGTARFVLGLSKKVLLADRLYEIYAQLSVQSSNLSAWVGAFAFMLYIYFEFSGYADMTIGLGRIFGFRFCENFDRPYTADSVSGFWRRWHMSLGLFFRDYVYIPLGGNRKGIFRQWGNLFLVWLLTGLWHGFTLPFLLWGLYFFLILLLEKSGAVYYQKIPRGIRMGLTQLFVLLGWVIFAAPDGTALYYSIMKLFVKGSASPDGAWLVLKNSGILLSLSTLLAFPGPCVARWLKEKTDAMKDGKYQLLLTSLFGIVLILLLVLCTAALLSGNSKPSMYASF